LGTGGERQASQQQGGAGVAQAENRLFHAAYLRKQVKKAGPGAGLRGWLNARRPRCVCPGRRQVGFLADLRLILRYYAH
jgi:hypothetical protein